MKKSFLYVALAVGIMSFLPSMQVGANYYIVECPECGEYGSTDTVLNHWSEYFATIECTHKEEGTDDIYAIYEEVRFYCMDCDCYWIEIINSGTGVECFGYGDNL